MRITVIGGTGLIGTRVTRILKGAGHDVVVASRATGVNSFTGEGLDDALAGASAVVDVSNSSYTDEAGAQEFFSTSTMNLLAYGEAAGVSHHVALSVVGTDRLARAQGGYFIAKHQQERLIAASGRPYTLVHATQFFEFVGSIADVSTDGDQVVRLPGALVQPIAADDVATTVVRAAAEAPRNADVEVAGPEQFTMDELVRRGLAFRGDPRTVVQDPDAGYYGARIEESTIVPVEGAEILPTTFEEWLPANPPRV